VCTRQCSLHTTHSHHINPINAPHGPPGFRPLRPLGGSEERHLDERAPAPPRHAASARRSVSVPGASGRQLVRAAQDEASAAVTLRQGATACGPERAAALGAGCSAGRGGCRAGQPARHRLLQPHDLHGVRLPLLPPAGLRLQAPSRPRARVRQAGAARRTKPTSTRSSPAPSTCRSPARFPRRSSGNRPGAESGATCVATATSSAAPCGPRSRSRCRSRTHGSGAGSTSCCARTAGESGRSSSSTSRPPRTAPPSEIHQNQLRLYAAAAERLGLEPVRLSIHDLDSEKCDRIDVPHDAVASGRFTQRLQSWVAGIRAGTFTPAEDRGACRGCDFAGFCRHAPAPASAA
jgi:hypothetical protein